MGLTGGIGTGKSEALRAFRRLGAATLCLDEVAHQVLAKGGPAYGPVRRAFGREVLGPGGEIDRRALGRAVFAEPRLRRRLERLTHPAILARMRRRVRAQRRGLLVVDAPLLFEAGLEKEFDLTAVVTASGPAHPAPAAPRRPAVARTAPAHGGPAAAAQKARRADVVISNDGTLGELRRN